MGHMWNYSKINCRLIVVSVFFQIFKLEKELAEVQRAAGLPVQVPSQSPVHHVEEAVAKTVSPVVQSTPVAIKG